MMSLKKWRVISGKFDVSHNFEENHVEASSKKTASTTQV